MGYTEHVGRGARRVLRRQYSDHFSLSLLPLFEQAETPCPRSPPSSAGRFPVCRTAAENAKNGRFGRFWASNARQKRFVKNLSKSVQDSFTICRRRWGILILPEGKTPARRHPFSICFLSFTFSFYPLFHFALARPALRTEDRALPFVPGKAATNLSQAIQNLFTHCAPRRSILNTSAGEAASPTLNAYQSLFLFYPPFSNLCSESASAAVPFPPTGGGALLYAAGGAPPSPQPDENGADPSGARGAAAWGGSSPPAAAPRMASF